MSAVTPQSRPVVYVGPSAPADRIMAILPTAIIRPPAKRGDIYRDRLLRFSIFVLIDGVFAQDEALSPREIVDVLRDGARLIGASSMGALRACDCEVAGAEGIGAIFRLFRRGAVSSEDEVAVTFNPAAPYPTLTQSHVNVRIALRRAVRAGAMDGAEARRMAAASVSMHYSERTWANIAAAASVSLAPDLARCLASCDAKRDDALLAVRHVADRIGKDPGWGQVARRDPAGLFGLGGAGRERPLNVMLGREETAASPGFIVWMLATGRATPWLDPGVSALGLLGQIDSALSGGARHNLFQKTSTAEAQAVVACLYADLSARMRAGNGLEAEWLRYDAACLGTLRPQAGPTPNVLDMTLAGMQIVLNHGCINWRQVVTSAGKSVSSVILVQSSLANGQAFRRAYENVWKTR